MESNQRASDLVKHRNQRVELRGFEPLTPSMRTRCATGLRYSPKTGSQRSKPWQLPRRRQMAQGPCAERGSGVGRRPPGAQQLWQRQATTLPQRRTPQCAQDHLGARAIRGARRHPPPWRIARPRPRHRPASRGTGPGSQGAPNARWRAARPHSPGKGHFRERRALASPRWRATCVGRGREQPYSCSAPR
jgi:hypothetical protein